MVKTAVHKTMLSNAVHCCPLATVFIGTSNMQHDNYTVKHYIKHWPITTAEAYTDCVFRRYPHYLSSSVIQVYPTKMLSY